MTGPDPRGGRGRGVVHRRDDTRLRAHVRTVRPAAPGLGAGRDLRRRAAGRRARAALQRRADRRRPRRRPARGAPGHHGLSLGPRPPLVDRPEGRLADVQRPGRDDHHQPGLPGGLPAPSLPRPGRRVLRVAARGHGPPAVRHRPRRRPAARPGRAVGRLARSGQRPGGAAHPADVHDRHDDAQRRRWPTSTTGCRSSCRRRRLGPLAGPDAGDPGELLALLQPTDEIALRHLRRSSGSSTTSARTGRSCSARWHR